MPETPGPNVPFPPMEAELVSDLPEHGGWRYEPKWDGFRGVLENDGGELALWSRHGRRRRGAGLAADAAGGRLRRCDRQAARTALPSRIARRRRQGEAVQDRGLRRRGCALQGRWANDDRDPSARSLRRRRAPRLRR